MQKEDTGIDSFSSSVSFCPSFNCYSSARLVAIASTVSQEEQRNDDDFEFVSIKKDPDECQLFSDGQIPQVFPVFNQDLLLDNDHDDDDDSRKIRLPLKNLFIEEGGPPSSSSSDADELEGLPEETYCVWVPNKNNPLQSCPSPNRCQKSNSTGSSSSSTAAAARSSKRWLKFRDLLKRSNSDGGKDPYAFLTKPKTNSPPLSKVKQSPNEVKAAGKTKAVSAHEAFYVKNRAIKQGDKKKSYLPYKLGFIASNVNSVAKSFPPF